MMAMEKKPTIEELRQQTGMKKIHFLRSAGISTNTLQRIERKDPSVSAEMYWRCLRVINAQLGTSYDITDIEK